jgi:nitroreductase
METRQVVKERRSIRKFKSDPIPEALIKEILDEARWSPSWGNTQPWELYVITGEPLEKFRAKNCSKFDEGVQSPPDIKMPENWTERLKKRYSAVGRSTINSLNISREDAEGRNEYARYVYRLFEAPCLIVACVDKCSSSFEYAMLDVGLIVQTICLLAHDQGLGSCIMACAVRFPSDLKNILPESENKLMAAGIALGYPDWEARINNFKRDRAPLEESVIWVK